MKFRRKDIDLAYRKLKSNVYYDNFSLLLRQQIAEFESKEKEFEQRLERLEEFLKAPVKHKKYFEDWLKQISYTVAPKSFARENYNFGDNIVSNNFTQPHYNLKKVNYFFEGPIELHLISLLWIIHEGYVLHKDYAKDNYAYSLELNPENGNVVDGLRLFKPYFEQYQKWRDTGVDIAQNIVAGGTDVVILSLDIKEYYYNVSFPPEKQNALSKRIADALDTNKTFLTDYVFRINEIYQKVCPKDSKGILPIGILSSALLANWYLKDFDAKIKEQLAPAYYGRYVDDIVIVLSNTKISKKFDNKFNSPLEAFLNRFFVERDIFKSIPDDPDKSVKERELTYQYSEDSNIQIQKEKITIYSFESKESQAVLDMFKKRIEQNSSAFWFLPNENDINDDFDESVYELTYTDTVNKLRSVADIKQSKYGASVFLAKRIKVSLLSDVEEDDKTTDQILTFFKGTVNLEFSNLWEKVLTYFVITYDKQAFWTFFKETCRSIDLIRSDKGSGLTLKNIEEVKKYLGRYLMNCCAMATALNPSFVKENWWEDRTRNYHYSWLNPSFYKKVFAVKNAYITSNLLRHNFVVVPLLNYLNLTSDKKTNLIKYDYLRKIELKNEGDKLNFDDRKLLYSPRFIYLHEFNSIEYLKRLVQLTYCANSTFQGMDEESILNESFQYFFKVNYEYRNTYYKNQTKKENEKHCENLKDYYFQLEKNTSSSSLKLGYNKVSIPQSKKIYSDLKIAVANTKVQKSNISKSLFDIPNTNAARRKEFINILNDAERLKSDILILPEVSTPYRWLPLLADQAKRKQRAIIVGLEHLRINDYCYNLIATLLPLEHNGIKDVVINLRLKNHYSPGEINNITNRGKLVPIPDIAMYNLFKWGGIYFSNYNCYELADINHRALFKSKVDLLFASEYNQDVNHFSNIVETVSRDVHCYFVQANSSDFGDSRITAPRKTESKDILRLKGGENSVVLLGKLNIKELRDFQKTRVPGQNTAIFKNTPPDFDHTNPENR
ncbi:MAG: RNA-directed DNA polymerase [Zunongwangia sp.]|uniref:RNA-directed DNA polymerase n=1 Tax=Zunongwangia sp. TaxID=1965325 RepID=UPI003241CB7D